MKIVLLEYLDSLGPVVQGVCIADGRHFEARQQGGTPFSCWQRAGPAVCGRCPRVLRFLGLVKGHAWHLAPLVLAAASLRAKIGVSCQVGSRRFGARGKPSTFVYRAG